MDNSMPNQPNKTNEPEVTLPPAAEPAEPVNQTKPTSPADPTPQPDDSVQFKSTKILRSKSHADTTYFTHVKKEEVPVSQKLKTTFWQGWHKFATIGGAVALIAAVVLVVVTIVNRPQAEVEITPEVAASASSDPEAYVAAAHTAAEEAFAKVAPNGIDATSYQVDLNSEACQLIASAESYTGEEYAACYGTTEEQEERASAEQADADAAIKAITSTYQAYLDQAQDDSVRAALYLARATMLFDACNEKSCFETVRNQVLDDAQQAENLEPTADTIKSLYTFAKAYNDSRADDFLNILKQRDPSSQVEEN